MISTDFDSPLERLVQRFAPGSALRRAWALVGGISATMTALEIERPNGSAERWILRQPGEATRQRNPNAAEQEFRLLHTLQTLGLPAPKPYFTDETGTIFATPYLVIEYIEGAAEFAPTDRADYCRQAAAWLARIHQAETTQETRSFLSNRAEEERIAWEDSLVTPFALSVEPIRAVEADVFAPPSRNPDALLHGDFWAGNLLCRENRLVAVIDWEDARLGDPLMDFAISRLDMFCLFGAEALEEFTQAYRARMALDYAALPYWDLRAALRLAHMVGAHLTEWVAFFPPLGRSDLTERVWQERHRDFIEQALSRWSR